MSSSQWQRRESDPFARVWTEVKRVRRDTEQRVNYLLRNAGLRVAEGALHVLQRLVVEGDQEVTGSLDVTGRTTLGGDTTISGDTDVTGDLDVEGRAGFTGDTTIGGQLSVIGALSLPAGIIDNDALSDPLAFRSNYAIAESIPTLGLDEVTVASFSLNIPEGFTNVTVQVYGISGLVNPRGGDSAAAARVYVQVGNTSAQAWSARYYHDARGGRDVAPSAQLYYWFTDLPGGTLNFWMTLAATAEWVNPPGGASVGALAIFTR